jgi:hypothetical protein
MDFGGFQQGAFRLAAAAAAVSARHPLKAATTSERENAKRREKCRGEPVVAAALDILYV